MAKPGDTVDNIYASNVDTFQIKSDNAPEEIKNKTYYPQIHVNESTGVIEKIEIKEPGWFGTPSSLVGHYVPNDEGSYDWVPDTSITGKEGTTIKTYDANFDEYAKTEEGQDLLLEKSRSALISDVMTNGTPPDGIPLSTDETEKFVKTAFKDSDKVQQDIKDEENTVPGTIPPSAADPDLGTDGGGGSGFMSGTRSNFSQTGDLKYPINLSQDTQDTLKIDMMKYKPKELKGQNNKQFGTGTRGNREIIGTVFLPIPGGIKDSNKTEWKSDSMNTAQMEAGIAALAALDSGVKGFNQELKETIETLKKTGLEKGGDALKGIEAGFAGAAIGKDEGQMLSRVTGMIMNPNMELLFSGPSLRDFSFTFLLAPRNKKEAEMVIKIIRFFKQGMAPIRSGSNLFLKAPHTFQLQYQHKTGEHQFLNKFKECALKTCDINYTPENSYSTYEDGVMTAYSMSLSFSELEPIYNDDYGTGDDASTVEHPLGF